MLNMPPLCRGLARGPLKAETGVRIPSEVLIVRIEGSGRFFCVLEDLYQKSRNVSGGECVYTCEEVALRSFSGPGQRHVAPGSGRPAYDIHEEEGIGMRMSIGQWNISVDTKATRALYAGEPEPSMPCTCAACRNFRRSVGFMPLGAVAMLRAMGVDPLNPTEHWAYGPQEGGRTLLYGASWRVCGRIISGPRGQACAGEVDGVRYSIGAQPARAYQKVREPALRLEVTMQLPWLLEEKMTYGRLQHGG